MTTFPTDESYANIVNAAPHPAAYCQTVAGSADATFRRPSRWLMISDLAAKAVQLVLAGKVRATPVAIVGVSGDISAAAGGVFTSTTGGKFSTVKVNDQIVIKGFANATNNGQFKVTVATGTSLTVVTSGGSLAPDTVAETPAAAAVTIQAPDTFTPDGVTLTLNPGVMYPICATKLVAAGTTAGNLLVFY